MRVHELARKLNKESKEIINLLKDKNIEVKNHMSTLSEDAVAIVERTFSKNEQKSSESKTEEIKKPSNITQVYNPQNSRVNNKTSHGTNQSFNKNKSISNEAGSKLNAQSGSQNHRSSTNSQANTTAIGQEQKSNNQRNIGQNNKYYSQNNGQGQNNNQNREQGQNSRNNTPANGQNNRNNTPANGQNNRNNTPANGQNNRSNNPVNGQNNRNNNPVNGQNNRNNSPVNGQNNRNNSPVNGQNNRSNNPVNGQNNRSNNPVNGQNNRNNTPANNQNSRNNNQANNQNSRNNTPANNQNNRNNNQTNNSNNRYNNNQNKNNYNNKNNFNNKGKNNKQQEKPTVTLVEKEDEIKTIILPDTITIKTLAEKMKQQPSVLVKKLFLQGTVVTINQEVEFDTAAEIALEYNFIAEPEVKIDVIAELLKEEEDDESTLVSRPPVVCVMGHVDHGKTSLLDAIRQTKVIEKEAGGITQHIGAYVVNVSDGQKITFLDTPGHEAFTAMRMRGANSTDIAILVVAADDGVMPQTVEAINHAKAAGIEIIVAINKMDKPSANIDKVKQELAEHELISEDWGGSTIFVPVSAHTKEGIDDLLEMILLTADMLELKANAKRNARGIVIEAKLDKGKGSVATILVQKGTLHVGDAIAVGSCHGKVRAMMDDKGRRVKEAKPSTPVEILGLNDVPNAGEILVAMDNEKEARSFAETFISEGREKLLDDTKAKLSLDDLFSQIKAGSVKELGIIVKADVQGSVEAIKQSLVKLSNEEVIVKIVHGGVGAINESDVILASASNAIIIGFNVRPDITAKSIAEREKVDLRLYRVIYDAIEDVEAAMKGMLDPVFEEKVIGHAEVRQTFKASGIGTIAGSYVLDGIFQRGCSIRVSRENEQIYEGQLASLKRFKDDVKEVKTGYECGLVLEKYNDLKEGDIVEAYTMVEVPR
ncbi:translation initiation factor IF-2 [Lachnotalea glycerini]|uniref:Translation initiation factor IF-2 n=1 Tax=Lachnotalea glycerini TaxID=1763509 RepID=A0A318EVP5_9FIRM|nr:translation initiation factor IF-2 [Lachnotalea glycerini]PXV93592.1 translation initiation factor IF-2 [Lachnotalea glycerini]